MPSVKRSVPRRTLRHVVIAGAALLILPPAARAAEADHPHRTALVRWVAEHRQEVLDELRAFLRLPNPAGDRSAMLANADHLTAMLRRRGMAVREIPAGGASYLLARLPAEDPRPGPVPRLLVYAHYDGQPTDPGAWTTGDPFDPRLLGDVDDPEARLYARSAADDKGSIVALLAAVDALRGTGIPPSVEVAWLLDPEEEIGSPNLRAMLRENAELLRADLLVFADGPVHVSRRPTLVFGCRGLVTVRLTLYGPARPLHSGHYGNWAPNPAERLARLLASMKDAEGQVLVDGFYDGMIPLSEAERAAVAAIPSRDAALRAELLLSRSEGGRSLEEAVLLPSLNLRGLASGWVGDAARTIVPAEATAEIDLRLVPGIRPEVQVERLRAHITEQGFRVVDRPPDPETRRGAEVILMRHGPGVPATRTPLDLPMSRRVTLAVRRAAAAEPVLLPTLGGTVPLAWFTEALQLPVYGVPIANPDNNQHAPDENLRLGNLWDGIVLYASLLRLPPPDTDPGGAADAAATRSPQRGPGGGGLASP